MFNRGHEGITGSAFEVSGTRIHDEDFAATLDFLVKRSIKPEQLLQSRIFRQPSRAYPAP